MRPVASRNVLILSRQPNQFFFFSPLLTPVTLELLDRESEPDVVPVDHDVEKVGLKKELSDPPPPIWIFAADLATTPRDEMPRSGQNTSFVRLE